MTEVGKAPKPPKGYVAKAHKIAKDGAVTVRAAAKQTSDLKVKVALNRTLLYDRGCNLPGVDDPEFTISF